MGSASRSAVSRRAAVAFAALTTVSACTSSDSSTSSTEPPLVVSTADESLDPERGTEREVAAIDGNVATEVLATSRSCLQPVLDLDGETWSSCQVDASVEVIEIVETVVNGNTETTEVETYVLLDGALVHAVESITSTTDGNATAPWSVTYEIVDGVVVAHESLGLGPTELDGWDPNEILDRWAGRASTVDELR